MAYYAHRGRVTRRFKLCSEKVNTAYWRAHTVLVPFTNTTFSASWLCLGGVTDTATNRCGDHVCLDRVGGLIIEHGGAHNEHCAEHCAFAKVSTRRSHRDLSKDARSALTPLPLSRVNSSELKFVRGCEAVIYGGIGRDGPR